MNHTVSFEMAKRLKDAGWPHQAIGTSLSPFYDSNKSLITCPTAHPLNMPFYAAPILTELLDALPKCFVSYGCDVSSGQWSIQINSDRTRSVFSEYQLSYTEKLLFQFESRDNPCDAAAELWLWCKPQESQK